MKADEIKINGIYTAKVSDKLTGVRIMKENPHGGWDAVNITTNKPVRIQSARQLRGLWNPRAGKNKTAAATSTSDPGEKLDAKPPITTKAPKKTSTSEPGKKLSGLDAAAKVLAEAGTPLTSKDMVDQMIEKGYWHTGGQTPAATIYAAIIREIAQKGNASRFKKVERGKFTLNR